MQYHSVQTGERDDNPIHKYNTSDSLPLLANVMPFTPDWWSSRTHSGDCSDVSWDTGCAGLAERNDLSAGSADVQDCIHPVMVGFRCQSTTRPSVAAEQSRASALVPLWASTVDESLSEGCTWVSWGRCTMHFTERRQCLWNTRWRSWQNVRLSSSYMFYLHKEGRRYRIRWMMIRLAKSWKSWLCEIFIFINT